jgi:hypothetical protein
VTTTGMRLAFDVTTVTCCAAYSTHTENILHPIHNNNSASDNVHVLHTLKILYLPFATAFVLCVHTLAHTSLSC